MMNPEKQKDLEDGGWVRGDAEDFLGLTREEINLLNAKIKELDEQNDSEEML